MHSSSEHTDSAEAYFLRGKEYSENGKLDEALEAFSKAIELNPNHVDAYYGRGIVYGRKADFKESLNDFKKVLSLDSNYSHKEEIHKSLIALDTVTRQEENATYLYKLGVEKLEQKCFPEAIKLYDKYIQVNPRDIRAYNNRGSAYQQLGKYVQAILDFTKAIECNPECVEPYVNRAACLQELGKLDDAFRDIEMALKISPDLAEAYLRRGLLYDENGDLNKASDDFTKAIKLKPKFANAYRNRAVVYIKMEEFERAIEDCDAALAGDPFDRANVYYNRACAWQGKYELDKAIKDYEKAIQLKPDYSKAYFQIGQIYHAKARRASFSYQEDLKKIISGEAYQEDLKKAIKAEDRAIELNPDFSLAYCERGISYAALGDFTRAQKDISKAVKLGVCEKYREPLTNLRSYILAAIRSKSKGVHILQFWASINGMTIIIGEEGIDTKINDGDIFFVQERYEEAIKIYTEVLEKFPKFAIAYYSRAECYQAQGKLPEAKADLLIAIKLAPTYGQAYNKLGAICVHMEETDEAIRYLREGIEKSTDMMDIGAAYHILGAAYFKMGDTDQALINLNEAIRSYPCLPESYYNRGILYMESSRYIEAISDFEKSIELKPDDAQSYVSLAQVYLVLKDHYNVIQTCNKAIEELSDQKQIYALRACTYAEKKQWDRAIIDATKAIELDPDNIDALSIRAISYDNLYKYDEAIEDCNKLTQLKPNIAVSYNTRASALIKKARGIRGSSSKTKIDEEPVAKLHTNKVEKNFEDADAFLGCALQDADRALELDPKFHMAYYNRGIILGDMKRLNDAIADMDKAIELYPWDADYYHDRGVLHGRVGHHDQAIADYSKALELIPTLVKAWTNRGVEYFDKGCLSEAIKDMVKALELDPDNSFAKHNLQIMKEASQGKE
jgi:tetratricopeptide (TPR) repeat protein